MDGVTAITGYVDRIVTGDGRCRGMKVLLLDAATTQIVSSVYSQSEVLSKEVYLVSRIDDASQNPNLDDTPSTNDNKNNNKTSHLKAVCYLRPTEINIGLLVKELTRPRFAAYHLFFTAILPAGLLRLIAESDSNELIHQIQEFYGDYLPIHNDLFSLNCRNTLAMTFTAGTSWARDHSHVYERNRQGLEGILLSLKRQPQMIRYQASSPLAQQLARDVHEQIVSDQIFHFRPPSSSSCSLLLVLDRMDDPVTPLLSQWTYQAMVHELLGLNNNRVVLKGAPNIAKDLEEVVLSVRQDDFFRINRNSNFGELGEAIRNLLQDYQTRTRSLRNRATATNDTHPGGGAQSDLNTIEDMQNFMEKFPELRSQSHTVSKHVAIMGELARLVDVCGLMDVSQFEQELACADDHSVHFRELLDKLSSLNIKIPDKLRLGLLYALRYEQSGNVNRIKKEMARGGVPDNMIELVDTILRYGGRTVRGPGLYGVGTKDIVSKMTKSILSSVQGVSNVYSQHVPVVMDTIQAVCKGKLKNESHPYIIGKGKKRGGGGGGGGEEALPDEIIIFMAGGVTYEEAAKISEFNKSNPGNVRVVLSGSTIHNSSSFLEELMTL